MKNILFPFLIIIVFLTVQYSSSAKPYEPKVKGGFKSLLATSFSYTNGKIEFKNGDKWYAQSFDEKGSMSELVLFDNNNLHQKLKIENKYNSRGFLEEKVLFDTTGKAAVKNIFAYDENSNLISDVTYNSKGIVTDLCTYVYDENNFMIAEIHEIRRGENEPRKSTTKYINDAKGNKITEITLGGFNSTTPAIADTINYVYEYNEKGDIAKETRFGKDGAISVNGYEFDEFGNMTKLIFYDGFGKISTLVIMEYSR